ncbi:MAG: agmatine deiminase family protein, partial [Candidatus Thermoplasmatota archaeon]|nr:agmatine deiminase family protein [Candidatus Thermoplasmatota archaeon]
VSTMPKNPLTFESKIIHEVEETYVEIIESLAPGERVDLLVDGEKDEEYVLSCLSHTGNVRFHKIRTADVWVRDYGPIFVRRMDRAGIVATKWIFNAWGSKYDDLLPDNNAGLEIAGRASVSGIVETGMVLEGGSIDANGSGLMLTTEQCLLNRNRNPGLDRRQISEMLSRYLGTRELIWLKGGIAGDDTDGHVDDVARFVSGNSVICMREKNEQSPNHSILKENADILRKFRKEDGGYLDVVEIQMPELSEGSVGLPGSYANFYIGNSAVLVPVFGCKQDGAAIDALREFFPQKRIKDIDCRALIHGFGALHCITQQQPLP